MSQELIVLAEQDPGVVAGNSSWMLISAALVLLMTPALAFFYGGMSRQKSAINMLMMSFGSLGVVGIIYILWGWSMSYGTESIGGIFANPFEFFGLNNAITDSQGQYIIGGNGYPVVLDIIFQLTFAAIACAIISGALANRVKFSTWLVFSALWVTVVYFPLAHMVWGGGILAEGHNSIAAWLFGTVEEAGELVAKIPPIDFAGGTVVHISAGIAALVLVLVAGNSLDFMKEKQRPHNLPLVMLGAALLWFGWFGFNGGSAFAADGLAGLAWLNTTVAACSAMMAWLAVERIRDGHVSSLGAASGVVAGLVSITPAAGDLIPLTALILGAGGGILSALGVGLKYKLKFDDSLDVVGVHLISGLWGTVAVGLFAQNRGWLTGGGADGFRLVIVQIVIAIFALVFSGALTWIVAIIIKKTMGWRIDDDAELAGIDRVLHSEIAYSEPRGDNLEASQERAQELFGS